MREANYKDPSKPIKIKGKVACVITFFIPPSIKKNYGHFTENKLESIEMNLQCHLHYRSGISYDIILINNGCSSYYNKYFEDKGYRLFKKENGGFSFGGWKFGWNTLKDEYDFFLFTEDDIAPTKDNWLADIVSKFFSRSDIGAVGNFVEAHGNSGVALKARQQLGNRREILYCFDGGWTFTSSSILRQVDKIGGLPVFPCEPQTDLDATVNEICFQQPILELGYALSSFDEERYLIHGSEVYTGDLSSKEGEIAPLINLNARHKIEKVKNHFSWLLKD